MNHYLTFEYWDCIKDEEEMYKFYDIRDINDIAAHPMQFTVWRYSAKSRMIVEFVTTAIMASIMHYTVSIALDRTSEVDIVLAKHFELEDMIATAT